MNETVHMERDSSNTVPTCSNKTTDETPFIIRLEKSKVSEESIDLHSAGDNCSENSVEEESENILNKTRLTETFYKDAQTYWKTIPATIDGMLGGFSNINFTDIRGSQDFMKEIFKMKPAPNRNRALDCGAGSRDFSVHFNVGSAILNIFIGIGRVSKHLLIPIFNKVDIVEQDEHFANSVKEYVGNSDKLGTVYNQGLQEFHPAAMRYDTVWCQWVLGHLTNEDLVKFFERCSHSLCKNGVIIVKENITSSEQVVIDDIDSSVTRPLTMYKSLFAQSGLRIVKMVRQNNFPTGIFPVYMFAMKPIKRN